MKWAIVSNWGREAITALVIFILAAHLSPTDFGIIAIASVYISFIQMFLESGFNATIIQRKDIKPLHLDSIFWLILAASLLLTVISILLSDWWSGVNRLPELALVICVLSLTIPIQGLFVVQQALLHRKMDFKSLALRDNISVFVGGCVGVGMAIAGFGVWALVGQQLCKAIVALLLLWKLSSWRPSMRFSIQHVKDLFGFSVKVFIGKLGVFMQGQSDAILMGIFFGPTAVGLYRFADRLMNMLLKMVTRAIQTVSLPLFSGFQNDRVKLKQGLLSCWRTSSIMTIPPMMAIAALSDLLMEVIGPKWAAAANVLKILCIIGVAKSITLFTGTLLQAISKPGIQAAMVWCLAIANTVAFIIVGIFFQNAPVGQQIIGIAGSRVSLFVLAFLPVNMIVIMRFSGVTLRDLMATAGPPLLSGIFIILTMIGLESTIGQMGIPPLFALFINAIIAIFVGAGTTMILDRELRGFLSNICKKKL